MYLYHFFANTIHVSGLEAGIFNWFIHRILILRNHTAVRLGTFFRKPVALSLEEMNLTAQRQVLAQLNQVSNSFCLAKWMQVTLHLHNGFNQSCHHVKSSPIPTNKLVDDPSTLHNTPFKMEMRKKMLTNLRPSECNYCWAFEDSGRLSDRAFKSSDPWASKYFDEVIEKGATQPILPTHVEVSFENTCNLKCMYCGPQFSTKWMEESVKFGSYPTADNHGSIEDLKKENRMPFPKPDENPYIKAFWHWWPKLSPRLEVFRITGGEPLLSSHTWKVFENLNQNPNTNLNFAINSNLSLPESVITRLLINLNQLEGKIKKFTLYTSIDTFGEQAEYIRYGLKFENYFKTVERILEQAQWPIEITFMITVNALSLSGLANLLKKIQSLRKRHPRHFITFDTPLLRDPKHMSIKILPTSFHPMIQDALDVLLSFKDGPDAFYDWEIQRVDRIRTLIKDNPYSSTELNLRRIDFYKMYQEYDRRKGTQFLKTFPEYAEFYLACKNLAQPQSNWRTFFKSDRINFKTIGITKTET